jgi:Domain of unknown function DUF488
MPAAVQQTDGRSLADLTRVIFGEALSMDELFARVEPVEPHLTTMPSQPAIWVGSVGYERHKDNRMFARRLSETGVERLVDVRELPISRRRGYAKTALSNAMAEVGIEYVHAKALGNPKPYRDLYKSGRVDEGRRHYNRYLLDEQRDALVDLVCLLREKRSALMCVEHDARVCHRAVILEALRTELGLELDICEVA